LFWAFQPIQVTRAELVEGAAKALGIASDKAATYMLLLGGYRQEPVVIKSGEEEKTSVEIADLQTLLLRAPASIKPALRRAKKKEEEKEEGKKGLFARSVFYSSAPSHVFLFFSFLVLFRCCCRSLLGLLHR
jgi:hypothetical protein